MVFDWAYALEVLPLIAAASIITIQATLGGFALAATLGLLLAVLRSLRVTPIRVATNIFIEAVRSTPLLIQLFALFYVLPTVGIIIPAMTAGILALGVHYSTYCAEVYRAGLDNVPRGQWEAATSLNFTTYDTFTRIILPQAVPPVVPALGNYLITMFKETPILLTISIVEMMSRALIIGKDTFRYTEPVTMVGVMFLIISLTAAWGIRRFGAWLNGRWG
jgi:polar amino acid transport system permease protein